MEKFVYTGVDTTDYNRARALESAGNWEEARKAWLMLNRKSDVQAVEMIIEANRKGDAYRELTKGVVEDWEKRKINNSEMHTLLSEAHKKVYG